ncbi:RHS repeat domain-containing protein [Ruminococcus sp.]|uniref:RHS repeat domain-containing protein n=1 Tax=Ruminococcus sp. TaxID=41978 RepID=UPI003FD7139F
MHSNTDYIIDYDKFYNTTENKVGSQVLTAFDYGTNNNILQKVTYGNGQTVNYNYDKYGNVKELFYNGKLAFSFLSDKTGSVMRHKDFVNNRQYDYDYDTTGRLVRQVKTDISKTDAENKFVSAYEYDYDLNNNITKLASKNGDSSIVHSFTYGKDNLLTEYSSDVSSKVTYTYDGLNRQTKSSVALKTPLDMSYTYYDSNRGENFTTTKIKEETIGKDTYKYEYDTNGNITDIYKKVNNDWQRLYLYEYDEFNQLITSCDYINQKQYRYDYDEAGNILTETVSRIGAHGQLYDSRVNTYGYDDSNWGDKLTSYNGETITYDEIGNPLSYRDGMTMSWLNGRNLTTLQSGNDSISYKYDSNGVRTSKTVNGVEYTYEYLNGQLMHETRGEKVFDYCYDANGQLYAVSYKANSSTDAVTYYFAHNWRGDITSIYDGDGNMVAKYEYDAWGNVLTVTNSNNSEITDPNHIANLNPFRYRSYYYDSESGLYYLMSRYYDPVVHRFLNADGYFQSGDNILDTNMNAYCQNNPIMNSDPTGNHPSDVICGNPTCPMCNLDRRKYLQTEKGLRNYNKYHGTNYIGMDDKGNFISNTRLSEGTSLAGNCLNGMRTVEYGAAGAYVTTKGCAAGLSAIATVPVTTLSIISHANNPYLTDCQKGYLIGLDCATAVVGVLLSAVLATTPLGWVGVGIGILYNVVTAIGTSAVENVFADETKRKWGYYE